MVLSKSCWIFRSKHVEEGKYWLRNTSTDCGSEALVFLYLRQSDDDVVEGKRRTDIGVHHKNNRSTVLPSVSSVFTATNFNYKFVYFFKIKLMLLEKVILVRLCGKVAM